MPARIRIYSLLCEEVLTLVLFYLRYCQLRLVSVGGGGTFGVVLESTVLASPRVTLQVVVVTFDSTTDTTITRELWNTMTANALQWAEDGWGGIATTNVAIYINPILGPAEAAKSMNPLIEFGQKLQSDQVEGAQLISTSFESWGTFFNWFAAENVAVGFISNHQSDRSLPFSTASSL